MANCSHCLLEFPDTRAVRDEIGGEKKVFCCHGCRGVARLISDEGLQDFYRRRNSSWVPGPPEEAGIDSAAFTGSVTHEGNEAEVNIILDGIRCASCVWLIEKVLMKTEGVLSARINYATHRARVRWDTDKAELDQLLRRIAAAGYVPKPFRAGAHEQALREQQRDLLLRFGTAAFFSMQLMMYSVALYAGYFQGISAGTRQVLQVVSLIVATPVFFYGGMPFLKGALSGLRNRSLNMDILIITGAGAAYLYSIPQIVTGGEVFFDTSAMIITLILLGRYLETGAKGKASDVILRLLSLNPEQARVAQKADADKKSPGEMKFIVRPVASIEPGDFVQVLPGEKVPLDGVVIEGRSEVDESMLTGESRPIEKAAGSEIFCGTQNLYGSIVFSVKGTAEETLLSRIVRAVEEAQSRRAPVQALADRIVGYFVPFVLLVSAVTGAVWLYRTGSPASSLMTAVSVLVIACPCALGLATPLAILTGTSRAASRGVLIKGGDVIEQAKGIDTVVLDKTGTVTEGKQQLAAFWGIGMSDDEALRIAASVEALSEHSISRAIVAAAAGMDLSPVEMFSAVPGKGVRGEVRGYGVVIGERAFVQKSVNERSSSLLNENALDGARSEEQGDTVVHMSCDGAWSGIFVISDAVRPEAKEAVQMLRDQGLAVFIVTGDSQAAAEKVASAVNVKSQNVMARCLPLDKAEAVKSIQERGGSVAVAGDGINDAPALIEADTGIAVGRATDIALESADMVLMTGDLRRIPYAISLSKRIYSVIRQNLFWAFAYNMVALPLAVAGVLHPIVAALAMSFSSLSVVGNSMRLKRM